METYTIKYISTRIQVLFLFSACFSIGIAQPEKSNPARFTRYSWTLDSQNNSRNIFRLSNDSPYQLNWTTDAILLGSGITARVLASTIDGKQLKLTPELEASLSPDDVHWFDRSAATTFNAGLMPLSRIFDYYAFVAPLPLLLDPSIRRDWITITTMYLETRLFAEALPMLTKLAYPRFRPVVYNPNFSYEFKENNNDSKAFFSNQSTHVFTAAIFAATVYNDYHPDENTRFWVWGAALTSASAIGVLRYATGTHYASDLLVGAAIGSALGYFIPKLHMRNKNNSKDLTIVPVVQNDLYLMNMRWSF
jgi:membrane-associated phospholipid phosphatase